MKLEEMIKYANKNIVPVEGNYPEIPRGSKTLKNWLLEGFKPKDIQNGGGVYRMYSQPTKGYRYFTKDEVEPLNEEEALFVAEKYKKGKVMGNLATEVPKEKEDAKEEVSSSSREELIQKSQKDYKNIIAIKVESTGLDFETDEPLRICIANKEKNLFLQFLKPHNKTSWKDAEKYHGITPEVVATSPYPEYIRDYVQKEFIDKADGIVFYNTKYNLGFLKKMGIEVEEEKIIDAQALFKAHKQFLPRHHLGDAVKLYFPQRARDNYFKSQSSGLLDAFATLVTFTLISREIKKDIKMTKDIDVEPYDRER